MRPDATFDFASSARDYEDVLKLILGANQHHGRFLGMSFRDMGSPLDACSEFVTCRVRGNIVGCARLTAVDGDVSKSQCALAGHVMPDPMWTDGFVEGHGLAISPAFQGAGLLAPMITRVVSVAYEWGYDYFVIGSAMRLLDAYENFGFREVDRREVTPLPGWTFTSALMYMDLPVLARNPPPGKWTQEVAQALARVSDQRCERSLPMSEVRRS